MAGDQHRRARAAEDRGGAVIGFARLLVQRLHAAPQRGRRDQPDQQGRKLHRMPPPMAEEHGEDPDRAAHVTRPACSVTWRSSVAASRALWVTIRKPQPVRVDEIARQRQHVVGGVLVEIAGRLVREQQRRLGRERAADRDALLLSAGQLLGVASQQITQAQPFDELGMPGGIVLAGDARLKREIVGDRKARDQVELLKHQSEPVAAQRRAAGIGKAGDVGVAKPDLAAIGGIEPRDQMQQRALAGAGFAGQRHALAGGNVEIDPAQHGDLLAGRAVGLGQVADAQHGAFVIRRCRALQGLT